MPDILLTIFIFTFGIVMGSFLNVLIYRIPNNENIAFPASKCQSCQTELKWYHNVPIFSWIFLRGKCAFCSESIAMQYPLIEFSTGIVAVLLFFKLGLVWYLPFVFLTFFLLLGLVMIDFKYMAVPDSLNLLALAVAVVGPNALESIQYALMAAGALALLRYYLSYFLNKEAMGEGDIIVAGTMGALLGFPLFFYALFLSAILAIIPSLLARDKAVPFVPFLAIATFIVYLLDSQFEAMAQSIMYG
ncbi:MAG TPA: prepilin peptidase [Campylobacterales bacterium]|nr:prepilin peptidase [Campylobacterales bacterium]